MKYALKFGTVILTAALCLSQQAGAWGDLGHQTIGEIAQQLLARDPETLRAIQAVAGIEPLYISATWPDDIRNDDRFKDFARYHLYDAGSKPTDGNAMTVLKGFPAVIADARYPYDTKLIAYRYIVHVVGDIHQPLHVAHASDYGGNACPVKWNGTYRTNLHSVWDSSLLENLAQKNGLPKYAFRQLAMHLLTKYPNVAITPTSLDPEVWAQESRSYVASSVYPDKLTPETRTWCRKDLGENEIPVIDEAYIARSLPIVEQRLVLAGVRLAAYLKAILPKAPMSQPSPGDILDPLKRPKK